MTWSCWLDVKYLDEIVLQLPLETQNINNFPPKKTQGNGYMLGGLCYKIGLYKCLLLLKRTVELDAQSFHLIATASIDRIWKLVRIIYTFECSCETLCSLIYTPMWMFPDPLYFLLFAQIHHLLISLQEQGQILISLIVVSHIFLYFNNYLTSLWVCSCILHVQCRHRYA